MRKYCFAFFAGLVTFVTSFSAQSYMPSYPDDEEFTMCTRVGTWEECAKDEYERALRVVKQQYRTILTTPSITKWHKSVDDSVAVLRDMYDSWTAFRTRLCSLSDKASMYMEPLIEEKSACNLYYVLHHREHLHNILVLMLGKAPENWQEFDFLKIYDHDEEYEACITSQGKNCIKDELTRTSKAIKDLYKTLSEDEFVGKWNNAPDLKRGNYRDMYDSWIAYRNRMCSLAVWAYRSYYGNNSMSLARCLQYYSREKYEVLNNLLVLAHSELDGEHEGDGDMYGDGEYVSNKDDGGLAEGRTIVPLERRIESGSSDPEDALVPDEENNEEPQEQPQEETRDIPAWAQ